MTPWTNAFAYNHEDNFVGESVDKRQLMTERPRMYSIAIVHAVIVTMSHPGMLPLECLL